MKTGRSNSFLMLLLMIGLGCQNKSNDNEKVIISYSKEMLELEEETVKIELIYYGMMCPCPQWATEEDIELYEKSQSTNNPIPMDSLFLNIVPENDSLPNPFDLDYSLEMKFNFVGRFYKRKRKWKTEDGKEFNCRIFQFQKNSLAN